MAAGLGFEPSNKSPSLLIKTPPDSQRDSQAKRLPTDLQAVIDAWPELPENLKAAILAIAGTKGDGRK